ncbi:uncharacterized protein [Atheta coriaria]|uniref:uncharacterized protein isoform X2 n=1 Tax=Dalotia coriaria TaxID=877792 RepID=UPI0031F3CC31
MQSSTTNLHPVTKRNKFINLLNSYVPTNERSWNYAIPIFGLSLSCFAFGMFLTFIENVSRRPIVNTNMYNFGYLVLAIAAGIELYYGMTHLGLLWKLYRNCIARKLGYCQAELLFYF